MAQTVCRNSRQSSTVRDRTVRQPKHTSRFSSLPLDISWLILDQLHLAGIYNVRRAFDWAIPGIYWRSRVPKAIRSQIPAFIREEDVNWEYLCSTAYATGVWTKAARARSRGMMVVHALKDALSKVKDMKQDA